MLASLKSSFRVSATAELALEANPEDLDAVRLDGYAAVGVNRLSIGVQSLDDDLLKLMRRPHDARRALASVDAARLSAVRSLGVDLILGLPGQQRTRVIDDIRRIVDRGVDHVSLYLLEVHERTRLGREVALGRRTPMGDDEAAHLYEDAADELLNQGFEHYEISNFARPGHRSRHNLKYWTDEEYLGFGPSAHSYVGERRWANAADLRDYLALRWDAFDRWKEEDEEVLAHPRDPFKRIDIRRSSRHVVVSIDGEVVVKFERLPSIDVPRLARQVGVPLRSGSNQLRMPRGRGQAWMGRLQALVERLPASAE